MMMIAPNSHARKGGKDKGELKGSMDEFEGRGRGILITRVWCKPVSNMFHHV